MIFDEQLLAWRRRRGMTQSALAARAHIPQPNIAALEAGRLEPKLSTILRLATALDISPGTLLDQRPPQGAWNRHRIDALARRAMGTPGASESKWVHALRIVASDKLAAAGRPVAKKGRTGERLVKQLRADLGPKIWSAVVRRLDKHL